MTASESTLSVRSDASEQTAAESAGHLSDFKDDKVNDSNEKGAEESVEEEGDGSDDAELMTGKSLVLFTIGMMAVVFMLCLDHYILATAIPTITTEFNSLHDAAWYSSGYFLTNMAVQPAFGQLYKQFPIKSIYLACLVVFELGSILCAVAPSSIALIIGRLVAGIGGGGVYIGSVVLVGSAIPGRRRPMYISMVTSLDGVASVAGPLLGGVFTDSAVTWRFCFWINLPIGFVAFVVLWCALSMPSRDGRAAKPSILRRLVQVDWLSLVLLLLGFSILLLALQWAGPVYQWSDPQVIGCIVGGSLALVTYLGYQYYQGDCAAIPYRVLRQRTVFASSGYNFLMNMFIGALVYYLPFQFQAVRQNDARTSGIINLAFLMPLMLSPLLSGLIVSLTGLYVPLMYLGAILAATGAGLITTFGASTSDARIIGFQFIAGFGGGLCHQLPYTSILHVISPQDIVAGSALCSFLNSLGAIFGIVIAQTIFTNVLLRNLSEMAGVNPLKVIQAGPTEITNVVQSTAVDAVRGAYNSALQNTYILPAAAACGCCIFALGLEWKRIKK